MSKHEHTFGQHKQRPGERRTLIVVALTLVTMVIEIAAGLLFGSMALLADGLHMASHAAALGVAAFAYRYARSHATDPRFSFGVGKVNALAGFAGALLLVVFALWMSIETTMRFINPVAIVFDRALVVAVLGLLVNGASVLILGGAGHEHAHDRHGDHTHASHHGDHTHASHHGDHNFRAAYLHVLADALTSLLAIGALLGGKYLGASWLDPAMGFVGAALVARWSYGLIRASAWVLVDRQADTKQVEEIRAALESIPGTLVTDLHVWSIGPELHSAIISIEASESNPLSTYKAVLPTTLNLVHTTFQVEEQPDGQIPG
jgi:cation diffusion facilitator family transporter